MPINPGYVDMQGSVTKIPGTGQNVVADALIGFAKGIALKVEDDRQQKTKNEAAVLQAMIQQQMVSPAGKGSEPDFKALGFGWKYDNDSTKHLKAMADYENTRATTARTYQNIAIDADPNKYIADGLEKAYRQYSIDLNNGALPLDETGRPISVSEYMEKEKQRLTQTASTLGYLDQSKMPKEEPKPEPVAPAQEPEKASLFSKIAGIFKPSQVGYQPPGDMASGFEANQTQANSSAMSGFGISQAAQAVQADNSATEEAGLTPPLKKLNKKTGKVETWYRVVNRSTGEVGSVDEAEMGANANLYQRI